MAKTKSAYVCSDCGASALQWFGACPSCGAAGTLTETVAERGAVKRIAGNAPGAISLDAVATRELERQPTGIGELDRVLGGGLVAGQVVLIGGDPGIGKSTLLLQALAALGASCKVLYISGEESAEQVAMRARRLALDARSVQLIAEIQLERIAAALDAQHPQVAVVDSIQTLWSEALQSAPGSVAQVRECAAPLAGTRPLLVEIQALVDSAHTPNPRRLSVGLEQNRLAMLLAVLHRHAGIATWEQDVFVNAVGGVRIGEPAADLAVCLAVISSLTDRPIPNKTVVFGEVGLAGEVRPPPRGQDRLKEPAKVGFEKPIVPRANQPKVKPAGIEVIGVERVDQAVQVIRNL